MVQEPGGTSLISILIPLFLKVDVLQFGTWRSSFLLVLYLYKSLFQVEYK
jgi:hypothetical protein